MGSLPSSPIFSQSYEGSLACQWRDMASSTPQSVRPETGNPTTRALGAKMTFGFPPKNGWETKAVFFRQSQLLLHCDSSPWGKWVCNRREGALPKSRRVQCPETISSAVAPHVLVRNSSLLAQLEHGSWNGLCEILTQKTRVLLLRHCSNMYWLLYIHHYRHVVQSVKCPFVRICRERVKSWTNKNIPFIDWHPGIQ